MSDESTTTRSAGAPAAGAGLVSTAAFALPGGLALTVIGMAAVVLGVVVRGLFLPGVIAVTVGLLVVALGAALRALGPSQ